MTPHKKESRQMGGGDAGDLASKRKKQKKKHGQKETQAVLLCALTFSQECTALIVFSCLLD